MRSLLRFFAAFCVATVFAELMILAMLVFTGRLNQDTGAKIVALSCGIDISADRIRQALVSAEQQEVPSFDQILERRASESLELDLRRDAVNSAFEHMRFMEEQLKRKQDHFDERREAYNDSLKKQEAGIQTESMKAMQQFFDGLSPKQAKDQLVKMLEDNEIAEVVTIIQGMPSDKTNKILKEFNDPADAEKLQEIIRHIRQGEPAKSLIDKALKDSQAADRNAPNS